jgi:SAM-dependent methyltransferase
MTPEEVWGSALALATAPDAPACRVRRADGGSSRLRVERFVGPPTRADEAVLARVRGPALDVGCGPGRILAALTRRRVPALGIDVSPTAVRLSRARGGHALCRSVFADVPGAGTWRTVLLLDGNVGIGGSPVRLLQRVRELLAPGGQVLVEVGPPGDAGAGGPVRLELGGLVSEWFAWGRLDAEALQGAARSSGLAVRGTFTREDRCFACLS